MLYIYIYIRYLAFVDVCLCVREHMIKVVLATNIAETSLTIEDIGFVIDSGRSKELSYDCHMRIQVVRR